MKKYVSILMALLVLWSAAVPEIRADATEAASYGETVVYTDETGESSEERVEIEVPGLPDTGIIGDSETEEDTSEDDTSLPGEDEDYTDTTTENPEEDTTDSDGGYVFPVEPTTSGEDPTTSDEDPTTSDEDPTTSDEDPDDGGKLKPVMAIAIVLLLALALAAVYFVFRKKNQGEQEKRAADSALKAADKWNGEAGTENAGTNAGAQGTKVSGDFTAVEVGSAEDSRIGKVHNIGRRRNQQDTLGVGMTPQGLLAVVSDGMGGLADGEKVSQTAVRTMLQSAQTAAPSSLENPLYELLAKANRQVLNMLGPDQVYKSGATLLAVLVANGSFHWVTVGDSRIYFYDGSHLLQMNSEHVFKRELIVQAVNGKLDFSRIESNNQKGGLVSFLGMGDLKYVEGSLTPVKLANGDRILLMSDGIFNTISEKQMLAILKKSKTAADAAAAMEKSVLEAANPKQDNFTCVILDV